MIVDTASLSSLLLQPPTNPHLKTEGLLAAIQRSLNLDNDAQKVLAFVMVLKSAKPLL